MGALQIGGENCIELHSYMEYAAGEFWVLPATPSIFCWPLYVGDGPGVLAGVHTCEGIDGLQLANAGPNHLRRSFGPVYLLVLCLVVIFGQNIILLYVLACCVCVGRGGGGYYVSLCGVCLSTSHSSVYVTLWCEARVLFTLP